MREAAKRRRRRRRKMRRRRRRRRKEKRRPKQRLGAEPATGEQCAAVRQRRRPHLFVGEPSRAGQFSRASERVVRAQLYSSS